MSRIESLPRKWASVLHAIALEAPWRRTPEALARQSGQDRESLTDLLADLHVAGLLEVVEKPEGIFVALSRDGLACLRGRGSRASCQCGRCPACRGCPTGPRNSRRPRAEIAAQGPRES
jgi:hypothetical protein